MYLHFRGHIEASPLCRFPFFSKSLSCIFSIHFPGVPRHQCRTHNALLLSRALLSKEHHQSPSLLPFASHASLRGRLMGSSSLSIAHCTGCLCLGLVPPAPLPHLLSPTALTWLSSLSFINQTSSSCSYDHGHRDEKVQ